MNKSWERNYSPRETKDEADDTSVNHLIIGKSIYLIVESSHMYVLDYIYSVFNNSLLGNIGGVIAESHALTVRADELILESYPMIMESYVLSVKS